MSSCWHNLDFLGTSTILRYNGYTSYRSRFGGFLSTLLILLGSIIFFFFMIKYLSKNEYYIFVDSNLNNLDKPYPLSDKFRLAIHTQFDGEFQFRDDLFEIEPKFIYSNPKLKQYQEFHLTISSCNHTSWDFVNKEFEKNDIKSARCVDAKGAKLTKEVLNWDSLYVSLRVKLKQDNKELENSIKSQILESLPQVIVYIIDSYYTIDKAIETKYQINKWAMNITYDKMKESVVKYSDDKKIAYRDNLISQSSEEDFMFTINSITHDSADRSKSNSLLYKIDFYMADRYKIVKIEYSKMTDFISQVGGSLNFMLICFQIFTSFFNNAFSLSEMLNLLFSKIHNEEELKDSCKFIVSNANTKNDKKQSKISQNLNQDEKQMFNNAKTSGVDRKSSSICNSQIRSADQSMNNLIKEEKKDLSINSNNDLEKRGFETLKQENNKSFKNSSSLCIADKEKNETVIYDYQVIARKMKDAREEINKLIGKNSSRPLRSSTCYVICIKYLQCCLCNCCLCPKYKSTVYLYNLLDYYLTRSMETTNIMKNYWDVELIKFLIFNKTQFENYKKIPFLNGLSVMQIQEEDEMKIKLKTSIRRMLTLNSEESIRNYSMDEKLYALNQFD